MTLELVLLLAVYAFLVLGAFLGDFGPIETFKNSAPRLAARIERNVTTARQFTTIGSKKSGGRPDWQSLPQ